MSKCVKLNCDYCNKVFHRPLKEHKNHIKMQYKMIFCSQDCCKDYRGGKKLFKCEECGSPVYRNNTDIKKSKSGKFFCNRSCRAIHMYKPIPFNPLYAQRSKLEIYIESMILKCFPDLNMLTNDREAVNLELDFYFPNLKLAIEINGAIHYEPIFGEEKLLKTQARDIIKKGECVEAVIKLVIVDNLTKFNNKFANSVWLEVKELLEKFV